MASKRPLHSAWGRTLNPAVAACALLLQTPIAWSQPATVTLQGTQSFVISTPGATDASTIVTFDNSQGSPGGTLLLGTDATVGGLSSATASTGIIQASGASTTLTVATAADQTYVYTGILQNDPSNPANVLSVSKTGAGTLWFDSPSPYTGSTLIQAGTLVANGGLVGQPSSSAVGGSSGSVMVSSGATLAGFDAIGQSTLVMSGGHLAPGLPPFSSVYGLLDFHGSTTLQSGANLDFVLNIDGHNEGAATQLAFEGPLALGGPITLNLSNPSALLPGDAYEIISGGSQVSYQGGAAGMLQTSYFTFGSLGSGSPSDYSMWVDPTGDLYVGFQTSAVPEPPSFVVWAGVVAAGAAFFRRRRLAA